MAKETSTNEQVIESGSGALFLAGNRAVFEVLLWAFMLLPATLVSLGAGPAFANVGIFAGVAFVCLFVTKGLRAYKDMAAADVSSLSDFIYHRYENKTLENVFKVMWLIFALVLLAGITSFAGSAFGSYSDFIKTLILWVVILCGFKGLRTGKVANAFKAIIFALFLIMIILLMAFLFAKNSAYHLLDNYGMAKLEGGASTYLNILYAGGEKLTALQIISSISVGLGVLGLPFTYNISFEAKDVRTLDRGRVFSIFYAGVIVVATSAWCLLNMAADYTLNVTDGESPVTLMEHFATLLFDDAGAASMAQTSVRVMCALVVLALAHTLVLEMYKTVGELLDAAKLPSKDLVVFLIMIFVCFGGALLIEEIFDGEYASIIGTCWSYIMCMGAPVVLVSMWKKTTPNGLVYGLLAGFATCAYWQMNSFADVNAGLPGFIMALAVTFVVSLATYVPNDDQDKLYKRIKMEL